MDPTSPLLPEVAKQAASGLLLVPVIWYAVKEIKRQLATVTAAIGKLSERINTIELTIAADATKHDVRHLKEAHERTEAELHELDVFRRDTERQLAAIWSKVGDRPEDKQRRGDRS